MPSKPNPPQQVGRPNPAGLMIECRKAGCGKILTTPGALIFGPPSPSDGSVVKIHLCETHWPALIEWLFDARAH